MDDFFSYQNILNLVSDGWIETLNPTILVTGIESFEFALNNKNECAGALAALDHSSTLLSLLYLTQEAKYIYGGREGNQWQPPIIEVEFRKEIDLEENIGITNQNGEVSLPSIWIHLGHGSYEKYGCEEVEDGPAKISRANDGYGGAKGWIDTKQMRSFIDKCSSGHLLLAVLPICRSIYSKKVLSGSSNISMIIGEDEEDIGQVQVEKYLNELQTLAKAGYDTLSDISIHYHRANKLDIE
uniref:Uncharacterized protein n=1 Tax=uncultured marine group II/III euryarchaeote KM3_92_B07 TaxID=1456543 RepID=A0A075HWI0_9EURY|nr:hypothetical protein [uncultured marine group II/III euryarchaeote KM3_92_B07]